MDIKMIEKEVSTAGTKAGKIKLRNELGKDSGGNVYASHQLFVGRITAVDAEWTKGIKKESALVIKFTFTGEEIYSHTTETNKTFDLFAEPSWDEDGGFTYLNNILRDQIGADNFEELSAEDYIKEITIQSETLAGEIRIVMDKVRLTEYMVRQYSKLIKVDPVSVCLTPSTGEGGRATKYYYNLQEWKLIETRDILDDDGASTPAPRKSLEEMIKEMAGNMTV